MEIHLQSPMCIVMHKIAILQSVKEWRITRMWTKKVWTNDPLVVSRHRTKFKGWSLGCFL